MIGILILLAVSWVLLYLFQRSSINVLGIIPNKKRLQQFSIAFLIAASLCIAVEILKIHLSLASWSINESLTWQSIWEMFYWDFKSVLTEELMFRGAILFILIKKLGTQTGLMLSAVAFGVYHWFSYRIFGDIIPMFFVFIGTGLIGYAWALAFTKTESMAMPIGFHLGWNFTFNSVFSNASFRNGIILTSGGEVIPDWFYLIGLWLVPTLLLIFVWRYVDDKKIEYITLNLK